MARTKGSKNGISRTKGYTAVGQRAKGRYVNGKWVYDGKYGSVSGNFKEGFSYEQKSPININPYAETHKKQYDDMKKASAQGAKNNWQQQANGAQAYDMFSKKFSAAKKAKNYQDTLAKGAAMGDAAKAADAQRKAEAKARWQAGNKAMAANKAKEQGAQNNWQQRANETASNRMLYSKWKQGAVNATNSRSHMTPKGDYNPWLADAAKGSDKYLKRKEVSKKAAESGAKNNWQQQAGRAELNEKWKRKLFTGDAQKQINTSSRAAAKKAAYNGSKNNWQQKAAREAAGTESENKVTNGSARATYMPRRHGGDVYANPSNLELDTTRKPNKTKGANAMRNDPRYTQNASAQKSLAASKALKSSAAESKIRNSRSDIGNAFADAKEDARKAWKKLFSKKKKKK